MDTDPDIPMPVPPRKKLGDKSKVVSEELQKREDSILKCFERLVKTEDGLFALQEIFKMCQCNQSSLILTGLHDVSPNILLVKQGRAGLWYDLRKYFSRTSLIAIEYPETKGKHNVST